MSAHVTAVVLTLNEEANLARCLHSLAWCQEIIVLDSGSSDRTEELALGLGARFVQHRSEGPFIISDQRNWALDNIDLKGDWVLFLDADEAVTSRLADQISAKVAATDSPVDAYELTPRYLFWGKWLKRTQGYPNWHHRLLRRGSTRFSGGVWEHFSAGTKVGRIEEPYDHYANSKGFADWLERHSRYSSWDAERIVEFLQSENVAALRTSRKLGLRVIAAHLWPLRPIGRFLFMYIFRLGFLEGVTGLVFCAQYAFYEMMVVVKVAELRRRLAGLPL